MTVCVTNSLSDNWGCCTQIGGFYLNNTLSLFGESTKTAYAQDKRPRTHFSPMIITGDSGEIMAIGSPGGNNIPRIIAPVLVDILKFGTDVQTAVDKSRVLVDDSGYACVEAADTAPSIVDVEQIPFGYYYSGSHMYFGCTSIVGYSPESGVYCINDARRASSDNASAIDHFFGW